jgi:hypothetical protein
MKLADYIKKLDMKSRAIEAAIKKQLVPVMGVTGVNHFKQNFRAESFDGKPWPDVKRRNPASPWYGFDYRGDRRTSVAITYKKGKAQRAKTQRKLNFSSAATRRKILTGSTGELGNSITYRPISLGVRYYSPKPYARVQNNGGQIKVFGKAVRTLKPRPFIGDSLKLRAKLKPHYKRFLNSYL